MTHTSRASLDYAYALAGRGAEAELTTAVAMPREMGVTRWLTAAEAAVSARS